MGEVYRADDLSLDQPVALKFLPEAVTHSQQALERFRNEVRIARQVSHPNVCRVYDLGEMEGLYFLSMEYVDGEDLGSLLRRIGRLPSDKSVEIARKLCAGLAAAHEKGVLHRDLKPSNVMLDGRGQVLLTDFGLAALAGEIEGSEVRSGTPAYMAPEQLAGEEVTVKSDIYALGLVLCEIFTGKRPFESDTLAGLRRAQRESAPLSPSTIVGDMDPTVEHVILRCLSPKPASRPASALSVAGALPGGDPLAAALAAGETPSPEMVAAAGEGEGLALKVAIPLLLVVLMGLPIALKLRSSALMTLSPEYGPEVLAQKSRDIATKFGASTRPFDEAS
jgi:serine/threonine-protein kinase